MTSSKLSSFQFFSLLFLTRLLTIFTYIPAYTKDILLSDMVLMGALQCVTDILLLLPVYFLFRKSENKGVTEIIAERSPAAAKAAAVIYCAVFLYFTLTTVSRLDLFAGTIVFSETNVNYTLIFAVLSCGYGAYLGIEALGRGAVLMLVPAAATVIFVLATLTDDIDTLNFTPLFYNGAAPFLKTLVKSASRSVELAVIAAAAGEVKGGKTKGCLIWIITSAAAAALIFFFEAGVMGEFTSTQLFPFHSLAAIADFSMFRRLDSIITIVWLLCAFFKISMLFYCAARLLSLHFKKISFNAALAAFSAVSAAACFYVTGSINRFVILDSSTVKTISIFLCALLIPVTALILQRRKKYA